VLEYAAWGLFCRWSNLTTDQKAEKDLHEFFDNAARMGITTVQDMAMPITAQRVVVLFEKAPPPIRVRVIRSPMTDERGRMTQEGRGLPHNPVPLVTVSGTKWRVDGTPVERTASMREPYTDRPSTSGELDFSQKEVEDILRESLQSNEQLALHVVGDRAVENVLNAMEATGGEKVWSSRRVRIEHGDGLMLDLLPRAKRLGVVVVRNPNVSTIGELFMKRFGKERAQKLIPLRSLLEAGMRVAIGSDGPLNPYLNILQASTYDLNPAEAITREQAVIAYTLGSAWSEFAEQLKGTLEPGKLADLVVLSQHIFTVSKEALPNTKSVLTMVGGRIVYDAKVVTLR
jgi:predicted amidohydrolase YtcJ